MVVVGGGVIGLEVAASAVQRGCAVTLIEGFDRIMVRCVSPWDSDYLLDYHRGKGAHILCGARFATQQDRAGALMLDNGSALPAEIVVVGVGASPMSHWPKQPGCAWTTASSTIARSAPPPDIHPAGDMIRLELHEGYARVEHWRHAIEQATIAAYMMA